MRLGRRFLAVTVLSVLALTTSAVAWGYWTSAGTGSGTAASTAAVASVLAANTHASDLYPGAVMSVTVTVSNPNPYPVLVASISAGSSTALVTPACPAGSVTSDARPTDPAGLSQAEGAKTIPAGGSGIYILTTRMIAAAATGCQSRTFALPLTAAIIATSA